ncbi:hypothetical protein H2202_007429 [Exophiala xenobiotica]|nr:hypothetical protein H2202_007429 [Exophiala xenobiotica]
METPPDEKMQKTDLEVASKSLGSEDVVPGSLEEQQKTKVESIRERFAVLRFAHGIEIFLDKKVGMETQGIDRMAEDERRNPPMWNVFVLWCGSNICVQTLPFGVLGPELGLSLHLSIAAIVVGSLLGAACTAFTSSLGPKLGLRTIAAARYSFGFYGAKLCACITIIVNVGFTVIGVVVAGQILSAVSDYKMTLSVGIAISSILSYLVTVLGLSIIHTFERYAWIPSIILFLVLIGQASAHVSPSTPSSTEGLELAAIFLSYMAIIFAYASGWAPIAADYFCSYPSTTPQWKIFVLSWSGLSTACIFSISIGACVGSAAMVYAPYTDAYNEYGFGALISTVYHPVGWSKFALVVFSFTVIGQNTIMIYSNGLAAQLLGDYFHAVPRFIWSFVVICAVLLLALIGRAHLSEIITDFVGLLGYWAVAFATIVLIEDQVFRRRRGYDLRVWDDAKLLPVGAAAVTSLLIGYCAGGITGMDQTWYVGPIARTFGGMGGDVGTFLSFGFTCVSYPILRTIEMRVTGK